MKNLLFLILLTALIFAAGESPANEIEKDLQPYLGRVIRKIEIVRKNVFDDEIKSHPPFYYRWANSLHITTRESVIRRELLFAVGDTLDIQKVVETERNLRLAGFIGEVDIAAHPDGAHGVALSLTSTDLWTTKGEIFADAAGGNYTVGLAATEGNLLGLGKYIQVLGQMGNDQDGFEVLCLDGRLFGSRQALSFIYSDFTYNESLLLGLARPQFSLAEPMTFKVEFSRSRTRQRLFYKGEEIFRYFSRQVVFGSEWIYAFGRNQRVGIVSGFNLEDYNYSPDNPNSVLNEIIPADERLSYPMLGGKVATIRFGTGRFLDASGTTEDLALGASLKAVAGYSSRMMGANYVGQYQLVSTRFLLKPTERLYIGGSERFTWWNHDSRNERMRHRSEIAVYYKPSRMHLVALRGLTDFAWRQKSTYQVLLGGGNGLRGHSYYELAGDKLAVGNLEYRFYTPIQVLTVRLGAAAFFDFGNVWRRGESVELRELKSDIGLGLRFGLTKSSTSRVVNLDFARSLNENEYFISFGSTRIFSLGNFDINE